MRIIKILCCNDCPLKRYVGYTPSCGHVDTFDKPTNLFNRIPDWCHLDTPQTAGFVEASTQQPTAPCCSGETPTLPEATSV